MEKFRTKVRRKPTMPTAAGTSPVSKPSSALPSKGRAHFRLLAKTPSVFGMPDTEAKRSKKEQVWANARATSLIGSPLDQQADGVAASRFFS